MDEAIARCLDFKEAGADIIFLEVLLLILFEKLKNP
jgi:2-methylisocitrate lyase-like PEP mutase family enzyme